MQNAGGFFVALALLPLMAVKGSGDECLPGNQDADEETSWLDAMAAGNVTASR